MIPTVTMRTAFSDSNLLNNTLAGDSWKPWRALLIAAEGEELDDDERTIFKQLTHREREPGEPVEEFVGVVGRRGGKSRAISTKATYVAGLCTHPSLVPGERGVVLIIAADQRQSDIILDYIEANFAQSPILRQLVEARTTRTLRLNNGITIEVRAADFRNLRGPTYVACIADEVAFWMNENSANPDSEILNSVRPGLATTGGPLIMISSPYARRGEFWRAYDKNFGPTGDPKILVAQASSRTMNSTLPQSVVDRAMEKDPAMASAEWLGNFRTDIELFVSLDAVRAVVPDRISERPPNPSNAYLAFVDPSGGQIDSMTLAIAHQEYAQEIVVLDRLVEIRAPCSAEVAAHEFSQVIKSYGLLTCHGDKYGQIWVAEQFACFGISYVNDAEPKSLLYGALLTAINSRRVSLLDNDRLVAQLVGLERRTSRGGRDTIDHGPGGMDDVANCAAGAVAMILQQGVYDIGALAGRPDHPDEGSNWHMMRYAAYINSFNPANFGRVR